MNLKVIRDLLITLAMILFFALVIVTLNSCAPVDQQPKEMPESTENRMYYPNCECSMNPSGYSYTSVRKAEYNGHTFLIFGDRESRCIVHDPDCKCQKKKDSMFDW